MQPADLILTSLALLNLSVMAGLFIRLGEVHQRLRGVEWRLRRIEEVRDSVLTGGKHA